MTSSEIRQSFLEFFQEKHHTIVPSSSLLPDSPNLLFTNAGMNQFVPIFLGQAPCPYTPARAADTQKCIRAGGKHNDLEDVGFDTYHHTFFEMLGNWSFGDYFKQEAIAWAWELFVERWKIPPSRIYATVYQPKAGDPGAFDQEASDHWTRIFTAAGLDPQKHIIRSNENFWMMGDTGPCGPCSELHIDCTPEGDGSHVNAGDPRVMEIWNLVFIQFNANPDGTYVELPAKHVDTGMGFERIVSILQGTKGFTDFATPISNYDTDVFLPLFAELAKLTGKNYTRAMPASRQNLSGQEKIDVAFRVIADHIRTLSFSIADGIQPSNEGRGYVLRRILRRAVRYGRNLGLKEPFLGKLVDVLGATMGHVFPEVVAKADPIKKTLTQEEESFFRTLERGIQLFEQVVSSLILMNLKPAPEPGRPVLIPADASPGKEFPAMAAFTLYDTYGFPLDLTELMARERGMTVNVTEFNRLMEQQKERSRAAQKKEEIKVESSESQSRDATEFAYDDYELVSDIRGYGGDTSSWDGCYFIPVKTPFYAAMGGQVEDFGTVTIRGRIYDVTGIHKFATAIGHRLHPKDPEEANSSLNAMALRGPATFSVDKPRRAKIEAHHSATHLLHWALRKVLGTTVTQKGSYVGPDRLRFDFSHGTAVTPDELAEIERLVNEHVAADVPVKWEERPYAQVKGDPTILQFFGDKYGDSVRVVSIGDFSKELCGGTHVRNSAKVGYFKILHESAIAAGIRRIEAASGEALRLHLEELLIKQDDLLEGRAPARPRTNGSASPRSQSPSGNALAEATPLPIPALWDLYKSREKHLHDLELQRIQNEKDAAKKQEAEFQKRAATEAPELIAAAREINGVPFIAAQLDAPAAYLPLLADALKSRWQGVALLATADPSAGKVALLAAVAPAYTKKVRAGKIIQTIAPLVGGKGGGRPELAQGGGTNPAGLPAALAKAEELLG
jgi:alanyl-tRNA synthetase